MLGNWWHDQPLLTGLRDTSGTGTRLVLANAIVVLVAFIPFFAIKELRRTLGEGRSGHSSSGTKPSELRQQLPPAILTASRIAAFILPASAFPFPAISNAVP